MKIGFVIADDNEYIPVLDLARACAGKETVRHNHEYVEYKYAGKDIVAVKCGIGKVNAASAAAFLIAEFKVDAIINFGLSGAVSGLRKGDIVAGESYVECDFDLSAIGYPIGKKPQDTYIYNADKKLLDAALSIKNIKKAVCGCGDFFLTDKAKSELYKNTFGLHEFDMETGAVASVCHDCSVPFLAVREISDNADDAAPESYREVNDKCEANLIQTVSKILEII